jgi:hypothetical protein
LFEVYGSAGLDARQPALGEVQKNAVLGALKRMPQPWHNLFQELSQQPGEARARQAAASVIGEIGVAADVHLLLELSKPASAGASPAGGATPTPQALVVDTSLVSDAAASDFEACVGKLLERDRGTFTQVESHFFAADVQLQPLIVHALAEKGSLAAVEVLSHLLGKDKDLDLCLISAINRTSSTLAPPFDARIDEAVRAYLSASSEDLVREAALAAGRLEDSESLSMLVPLLSSANRGVRQNAHWSLKKISGLSFSSDARAWGAWLTVEESWLRDRAPALFARLETAERPEALKIVQEVARRRCSRHTLATELSRGTRHKDAEVRRLTCVALGQFRSRNAIPALLVCLDDPIPEVRIEAGRALRAVTGEDLPPQRAAWARAGY